VYVVHLHRVCHRHFATPRTAGSAASALALIAPTSDHCSLPLRTRNADQSYPATPLAPLEILLIPRPPPQDFAPSPLAILPGVVAALRAGGHLAPRPDRGKFEIFVDGGVRRATDVLKAVALGATAVGIGRPMIYSMSTYGEEGVSKALQILKVGRGREYHRSNCDRRCLRVVSVSLANGRPGEVVFTVRSGLCLVAQKWVARYSIHIPHRDFVEVSISRGVTGALCGSLC
jgi:hypothetical protein